MAADKGSRSRDGTAKGNRLAQNARRPLRSSLTAKFAGLFGCVIGAIAMVVYFYLPSQFEEQAREGLEARGESLARMAAFSLQSAVLFEDRAAMEETLRGLAAGGEVLYAGVVAPNGEAIVETGRLGTDIASLPPPEATPVLTPGSGLVLGRAIRVRGETFGYVWLALSTAPLEASVAEARRTITLTSLAIFIFGLAAVLGITATLTRSLSTILRAAEGIAAGDLTQRVDVRSSDEAGQLAETFNHMASELQGSETRLRAAMGRIEGILQHIPIGIGLFDLDGRLLYVNPRAVREPEWRERAIGLTLREYYRQRGYKTAEEFSPEDALSRCIEGKTAQPKQDRLERDDGEVLHVLRGFSPVLSADGTVQQVVGFGIDVTDRVEAQAALLESEARLIQAQKMESVGQLAGGVAHDFNNLLTAIIGHCDLMLFELGVDDENRDHVLEIQRSSTRAGELTRQLLAFGRKQVLQPKLLVLDEVVLGTKAMLSRLIDDSIFLDISLDPEAGSVMADAAQIEQVIVNLVLNACDALPNGGAIHLETAAIRHDGSDIGGTSLEAGRYVRLSVSDKGIGMDAAILERVFEPFFTTKGPNEGTGLGLSTAYGIVRQSGGVITAESTVDEGSTFRVFLPQAVAVRSAPVAAVSVERQGGSETVLLVEDQPQVRDATEQILLRKGYKVVAVEGPVKALEVVRTDGDDIDLLLTDVMMPEMSGPSLAAEVTKVLPKIGVLFMSGFTGDALSSKGVLQPGVTLIEKPFAAVDLYDAVRSELDQPKPNAV